MPTQAEASSPEVLFIASAGQDRQVQSLRKAGFEVVSKRPGDKLLDTPELERNWRVVVVHSSAPESFLRALARRELASPVLLLSAEWPCKRLFAESWTCMAQPRDGERLVRDFVAFLNEHPVRESRAMPAWVSQVVPATRAKSSFAKVLQDVEKGARVVVTRHDSPAAVVVSYEDYEALRVQTERALDRMRTRFSSLVAEMQTPAFERSVEGLFRSTSEDLGESAVEAALDRD